MTTYKQIIYDGGDKVLVDMAKKAQKLNTARSINVTDADGTHTGTAASFDGSGDVNIKLPATIKATLVGNADTATNAGHQTTADSATTATSATSAGTAASASEATKLSTARSIRTDLASASAVSFDGSADVTPGVTGVLPIANGGTGINALPAYHDNGHASITTGFFACTYCKDPIMGVYVDGMITITNPIQNSTIIKWTELESILGPLTRNGAVGTWSWVKIASDALYDYVPVIIRSGTADQDGIQLQRMYTNSGNIGGWGVDTIYGTSDKIRVRFYVR